LKVVRRLLVLLALVVAVMAVKDGWGPLAGVSKQVTAMENAVERQVHRQFQPDTPSDAGQASPQKVTDLRASSSRRAAHKAKPHTPVEPVVAGLKLKKTYHYRFTATMPPAGRQTFKRAIRIYNRTGIVHLVPGHAKHGKNRITFGTYRKQVGHNQTSVELGRGGPGITQTVSIHGIVVHNHAKASLNTEYALAYGDSIAVHELGHALGLDHSMNRHSVMYPLDQGKVKLSHADIRGLKRIYRS